MLETWLQEVALGVITTLICSGLTWTFRRKIWQELISLYLSISETATVLLSLCINLLESLVRLLFDTNRAGFSADFKFQFSISRGSLQKGSVGVSTASAAPTLRISDGEILNSFSATHDELVAECRNRYSDFKQNFRFYKLLESVKKDPNCAHERRLNPNSSKNSIRMVYNLDAVLAKFDDEYTKLK